MAQERALLLGAQALLWLPHRSRRSEGLGLCLSDWWLLRAELAAPLSPLPTLVPTLLSSELFGKMQFESSHFQLLGCSCVEPAR